jgi:hypothetical protein
MAKMKVPHGSLQLTSLGTWLFIVALPVQGALDPWRFGLVKTATTMKAATKRMSKMMSRMRIILLPPVRRRKVRAVATKVYRTAAAMIPSTAPLEREALWTRRTIFARRTEKRMREVSAERNCRRRRRCWKR